MRRVEVGRRTRGEERAGGREPEAGRTGDRTGGGGEDGTALRQLERLADGAADPLRVLDAAAARADIGDLVVDSNLTYSLFAFMYMN